MRKQYHFRHSPQGLLAWDVDRLIELTAGLQPETVSLTTIRELDESHWYGLGADVPTPRSIAGHVRLINDADLAYPIIVCPLGRVMDGMHRILKALLDGRESIAAYRLPELPAPDFVGVDPEHLPYDEA